MTMAYSPRWLALLCCHFPSPLPWHIGVSVTSWILLSPTALSSVEHTRRKGCSEAGFSRAGGTAQP